MTEKRKMDLGSLLYDVKGLRFGKWDGLLISGVEIDSKEVQPGNLFVALEGQHTHGAFFIEEAIQKGAVALILPYDCEISSTLPSLKVTNPRKVLSFIVARFYNHPSQELYTIGVTGTNGKSTFIHMIDQILRAKGEKVGFWSTPQVYTGKARFRPKLTTPEAHHLHHFLSNVKESGMSHACIEVSSHAVVQHRVSDVDFNIGVVTNVTPDHLDYHRNFLDYFSAKQSFVESLQKEACCILNIDDPWVRRMAKKVQARLITYGLSDDVDVMAYNIRHHSSGSTFNVRLNSKRFKAKQNVFPVTLSIPGQHNVYNSTAAIAAGLEAGTSIENIKTALAAYKPPGRRMETKFVGPFTIINDIAMNEASYDAIFQVIKDLAYPQIVVVNALRGNRGKEVNSKSAEILAKWNRQLQFDPLIVSQSQSHVKLFNADYRVRPEELFTFVTTSKAYEMNISIHEELPDAIAEAVIRLKPNGLLLLLGTFGMDEGASIAEKLLQNRLATKNKEIEVVC